MDLEKIRVILATDCGSTTSKARLFMKMGNEFRFVASGETPTTVEAPFEDVTVGVQNAVKEIEELTGRKMLDDNRIINSSTNEKEGVDLYVTTSSAGGGLQMMVAGVAKIMTAESSERAALGAGAIVMDVLAVDDGRRPHEKIRRIRFLRPDMILLAGGIDGGTVDHVAKMAELIAAAEPKARLGAGFKLPLVYAGNKDARKQVTSSLGDKFALTVVDNIRPRLDVEIVDSARDAVHLCFMEHVMSHAPGYDKLMKWTDVPIMPTPAAEGSMFLTMATTYNANVIGVGLGGATTNVYSVYDGRFVRTVSANLGMSYSICNVLKETGIENIMRWLPFQIGEQNLTDRLFNKMIRPTTIPQKLEELLIEHAVAREALRLGFLHHKSLARPLRGVQLKRDMADIFETKLAGEETYIDMMKVGWLGGTGGLLSHAPRRAQSALMLIDAFQPEGVTRLFQDSVFMMPHLGVLSTVHPQAAMQVFEKDCVVQLGTCISPRGTPERGREKEALSLIARMPDESSIEETLSFGALKRIPLKDSESIEIELRPNRDLDVGAGRGHVLRTKVYGGAVGLIIDARGRPLTLPEGKEELRERLHEWFDAVDAYPRMNNQS